MTSSKLRSMIESGALDGAFSEVSGSPDSESIGKQKKRAFDALAGFESTFGTEREGLRLFSVGGRSEISGNHTDHNRGKVIAASVDMNVFAVACPVESDTIEIKSAGFPKDVCPADGADGPREEDKSTSRALICGITNAFRAHSLKTGGLAAYTVSDVLKGSGLSSSAAFEVAVGKMLSAMYNDDKVENIELAKFAKYAENEYFGKPCGLMDQAACAVGGLSAIDFFDPDEPVVKRLEFDFDKAGYRVCITDTGSSHAGLDGEYAAIPAEMKKVANFFGKDFLSLVSEKDMFENIAQIRKAAGERAVLRAYHFFEENRRVEEQIAALERGDTEAFLKNAKKSGESSFTYLQNVYTPAHPGSESVALALMMSERFLSGRGGAWRIHGGGFAGTIQAFVPKGLATEYREFMEAAFGEGSCHVLGIRRAGALTLL